MTRKRGTMVRTFDASNGGTFSPAYRYALAWNSTTAYVICSEGVGWEVTADRPLIVDGWETTDGGMCQVEREMSLAEVITASVQGDDVDLADFVRTFGGRLDANVYLWQSRLGA